MSEEKQRNERLVVLFIMGTIILNYPLVALFSKIRLFLGVPVLYLYLFSVWFLFIGCVALLHEKKSSVPPIPDVGQDRPQQR